MSDDEDYNSEEDADYVPTEGDQVSEEENSGEEEDLSLLNDEPSGEASSKNGKKRSTAKKKQKSFDKKRKGGIKLEGDTDIQTELEKKETEEEARRRLELAEQIAKEEAERKEKQEKKRLDDLWNSFLSDVKKPTVVKKTVQVASSSCSTLDKGGKETVVEPALGVSKKEKVTITKIFDFAGEEVKVTKEVDVDSKEAKAEQKKAEFESNNKNESVPKQSQGAAITSNACLKRPASGGLGSVLSKIGKKSKMGTLDKSKIDWDNFKRNEGIDEDLKIHNKGKEGYINRMAFLNRTDQRQYERERDLRMATNNKR